MSKTSLDRFFLNFSNVSGAALPFNHVVSSKGEAFVLQSYVTLNSIMPLRLCLNILYKEDMKAIVDHLAY